MVLHWRKCALLGGRCITQKDRLPLYWHQMLVPEPHEYPHVMLTCLFLSALALKPVPYSSTRIMQDPVSKLLRQFAVCRCTGELMRHLPSINFQAFFPPTAKRLGSKTPQTTNRSKAFCIHEFIFSSTKNLLWDLRAYFNTSLQNKS